MLAVISNEQQYGTLTARYPDLDKIRVMCDNLAFYDFLKAKNVSYGSLQEEDLRAKWEEINTWACKKALLWGEIIDKKQLFKNIELDKALYVYFSYYLVSLLKNYLFAKHIIDKYDPAKIIIFNNMDKPGFPRFNGNYFLNRFLNEIADERGIEVERLQAGTQASRKHIFSLKENIRSITKRVFVFALNRSKKITGILVNGNPYHLFPFLEKMKEKKINIVFFDINFQFKNFLFCFMNRMRYVLPEFFLSGSNGIIKDSASFKESLANIFSILKEKEWFKYESRDFSGFIFDEINESSGEYAEEIRLDFITYSNMVKDYDIKCVVTNEDIMPKNAFMAAFFKSIGIKTNCISHGYQPIKFDVGENESKFQLSKTFVHSEYEKELYGKWGWDKDSIEVTGISRYDRLKDLKNYRGKRTPNKRRARFLFCGAMMKDVTPDLEYYMGVLQNETGSHTRSCLNDLIKILKDYHVELIIKPHYKIDERLWRDFVFNYRDKMNLKITLVSATSDFLDLLGICDAMFLGHWSTAIIEGAVLGIPVVVLNYSGLEDGHPFAEKGLCKVCNNSTQLKEIVQDLVVCLDKGKRALSLDENIQEKMFFTGVNDGMAAERIIDRLLYNNL